eukprot:15462147-Alexandrium_andersonii.AAC.1
MKHCTRLSWDSWPKLGTKDGGTPVPHCTHEEVLGEAAEDRGRRAAKDAWQLEGGVPSEAVDGVAGGALHVAVLGQWT